MGEKKNPHSFDWRMWVLTAIIVIQLLNSVRYYQTWNQLHDSAMLQKEALQYLTECLEAVTMALEKAQ